MSKEFQWTDELVRELVHRTFAPGDPNHSVFEKRMEELKQSTHQQQSNDKREWEILEMFQPNKLGTHSYQNDCEKTGCIIYSVKRISDGEVFTIGDFIKVKEESIRKGWSDPIISFLIVNDIMVAEFQTWRMPLKDIERMHKEKHVTAPTPQPAQPIGTIIEDTETGSPLSHTPTAKFIKTGKGWEPYSFVQEVVLPVDGVEKLIGSRFKIIHSPEPEHTKRFARHWVEIAEQPKERIEVIGIQSMNKGVHPRSSPSQNWFKFLIMNEDISPEKYPAIKSAIEAVLNDDVVSVKELGKQLSERYFVSIDGKRLYPEEQLREAEDKAFNAAREETNYPYQKIKFYTFQDYIDYLNSKKA